MFQNYLTLAWRNLRKHPAYTGINLLGLSLGLACCLLMLLLVRHEFSYDRFHEKSGRVFRVVTEQQTEGHLTGTVASPLPLAAALADRFPEVEKTLRLGRGWPGVMKHGEVQHHEAGLFFTDPTFFDVFDVEMVQGNPATALLNPTGIVLTEVMAEKYFGSGNPIGQVLEFTFEGQKSYEVTGVVKALPDNSHFLFDFLVPLASQPEFLEMMQPEWSFNFVPTYLLLSENTRPESLARRLPEFVSSNYPAPLKNTTKLSLQALPDIHLHSHLEGEIGTNSHIGQVRFYAGIALLLLLVACVNFMNLATARSADRAKEVGVRKVTGANRVQLVRQFLGEALLLTFVATGLGLVLAEFLLPWFNELTGQSLSLDWSHWELPLALAALATLTGLLAGSYPAFFLARFEPVNVLKGQVSDSNGNQSFRRIMVIGQFAASAVFLIAVFTMQRQLEYVQSKPLGFDREQVVYLRSPQRDERMNFELWRNAFLQVPGVSEATGTSAVPGTGHTFAAMKMKTEGSPADSKLDVAVSFSEHDFAETFGLKLAQGRDFSPEFTTDPIEGLLINQSAVQALGWEEGAIGRQLSIFAPDREEAIFNGRVVGVLEDFHFESLYQPLRPMAVICRPVFNRTWIALRLETAKLSETIAGIEKAWKELAPEWPMELAFLDQSAASFYEQEERTSQAVSYSSMLVVFIACLGLFGLFSYSTERRTKEIGIRKVLGASVAGIVGLLTRDFLKWVVLSLVIASPLAWWVMEKWLSQFAYRIAVEWWFFAVAGAIAVAVALLTVGFQGVKAALANPVKSLRNE